MSYGALLMVAWLNQGQMVLMTLILWQNLLSPGRATRSMSTSSLPVQDSGLVMVAILMMESRAGMPSVPPYEKTLDDDNYHLVLGALPHHGARHPSLAHLGMAKGGTESRHNWYGAPARPTPAPLPRQEELAFCSNQSQTGGLLGLIPRYV